MPCVTNRVLQLHIGTSVKVPRRMRGLRCGGVVKCIEDESRPATQLEGTIRRKHKIVEALIEALGTETLHEKLQDAVSNPSRDQFRFTQVLQRHMIQCRPTLIAEIPRLSPNEPASELGIRARQLEQAGFHAICVKTDSLDTSTPLQDLYAVVKAVRVPVLQRDWFLHPIQLLDCQAVGADGVLGIVGQISGKGTAVLSSFAASLGLDAPVEVVNAMEIEALLNQGVPSFAINCGVGIALSIPGIAEDMAKNLLGEIPSQYPAIVGVKTLERIERVAQNGATAILVKQEAIAPMLELNPSTAELRNAVQDLKYAVSGDY